MKNWPLAYLAVAEVLASNRCEISARRLGLKDGQMVKKGVYPVKVQKEPQNMRCQFGALRSAVRDSVELRSCQVWIPVEERRRLI